MGTPIGDQAAAETRFTSIPTPGSWRKDDRENVAPENTEPKTPDYLGDLLDAQHDLIQAQHDFMHKADVNALLKAQRVFINKQTHVLDRLGVYGND
jgi:hypothetical protein